jgi:hypothetical protein
MLDGSMSRLYTGENVKLRQSKGDLHGSEVNQPDRVSLLSGRISWFLGWLAKGIRILPITGAYYGKKHAPSLANACMRVNCYIERGALPRSYPIYNGLPAMVQTGVLVLKRDE